MIDWYAPPLKEVLPILKRGLKIERLPLPRALKPDAEKLSRTRTIAEVFTPSHVVKQMIDAIDDGQLDSRWLEIACGEAPFITNRYDAATGELIPTDERTGILDRKLRRAKDFVEACRALQSVCGYELQADSLLIARANVLLTFAEHVGACAHLDEAAAIIARNFWQMNALKRQLELFDDTHYQGGFDMKFDFAIGNPPYQDDTNGDNKTFAPPIYHHFLKPENQVAKTTVLITPARFLFNAGATPKDFNQRMLNDSHLKVLDYAPDAGKYFKGVDIKGGVAVTLRDETQDFGAIGTYIPFDDLKRTHDRVCVEDKNFRPFNEIIYSRAIYTLTEKFHADNPRAAEKMSNGNLTPIFTDIFERLPEIFFDEKPADGHEYIKILGLIKTQRTYKWIRRDYVNNPAPLTKWKGLVPAANGSGALGEVISTPLVGATQTFISVGAFDTRAEAEACVAYIKSKFCRAMLGILKVTQHNPPATWAKVPLQDFTASSDIDWGGDIDEQLYRKYGLDAAEIKFIETHVKAMT